MQGKWLILSWRSKSIHTLRSGILPPKTSWLIKHESEEDIIFVALPNAELGDTERLQHRWDKVSKEYRDPLLLLQSVISKYAKELMSVKSMIRRLLGLRFSVLVHFAPKIPILCTNFIMKEPWPDHV